MKPILVTGEAHYIGCHFCKTLAQDDCLPLANNKGYPLELVVDAKQASSKLGWSADVLGFEAIIASAWQ